MKSRVRKPRGLRPGAVAIATIGAAFSMTGLAILLIHGVHTKLKERDLVQRVQHHVDREQERLQQLRDSNQPPYLIRYQQAKVDAADRFLRRVKADASVALKDANQRVTTDAMKTLVSQQFSNLVQLAVSLQDTGAQYLQMRQDQLAGSNRFQQAAVDDLRKIESNVDRIRDLFRRSNSRQASVLAGEDLTIVMASVELAHIKKRLQAKRPGLSMDDPAYANALRDFFDRFYTGDDEVVPTGDFARLSNWIDNLIDIEFGPRPLEGSVWVGSKSHVSVGTERSPAIWESSGIPRYEWFRGIRITFTGVQPGRVKMKLEVGPYSSERLDPERVATEVSDWSWGGGGGWIDSNADHTEFSHEHTRKEEYKPSLTKQILVHSKSTYRIEGDRLTVDTVYVETVDDEEVRRDTEKWILYRQ